MNRSFTKPLALTSILGIAAVLFTAPQFAHAAWFDIASITGTAIQNIIMLPFEIYVLPLASGIMYLCGLMMDLSIQFSLNTAYIFSLSPAINLGWVIVRDIANIFFIFILIWISLGTIINGTRFGTMSMLKNVIVAALLINFSLFITKAVVDVSNLFGNWLYGGVQNTLIQNSQDPAKPVSLSGLIATRLGIINLWSATPNINAGAGSVEAQLTDPTKGFIGVFLRLAIVLITSYIFIYCAILFISRAITILFLLVFSPLGFMGGVLPQLKKHAGDWKNELLSAAVFPLATLLMLYIALQFINSLGNLSKSLFTTNNPVPFVSNFSLAQFFQYFLVIFLLRAVLKIAKENSGQIGSTLGGMADSLGKLAVTAVTSFGVGGVAMGARVLGRGAGAAIMAEKGKGLSEFGKAAKANLPPILANNKIGKFIKDPKNTIGSALKDGAYDIRNVPTGGGNNVGSMLSGAVGNAADTKLDLKGKDKKELAAQTAEWAETRKSAEENTNLLKDIDGDLKLVADALKLSQSKYNMESAESAWKNGTGTEAEFRTAQTTHASNIELYNKDPRVIDAKARIAERTQKLGNKQLEKLDKKILGNDTFLQTISQSQAEYLADKQESDAGKAKVWGARLSDVATAIKTKASPDAIKKAVKNHSDEELQNLPSDLLKDPGFVHPDTMDYDKFDKLMKNKKLPGTLKAAMKNARYVDLDEAIKDRNSAKIETELNKLEENEIAKLGWKDRLENDFVAFQMTPKILSKAVDELAPAERNELRRKIEEAHTAPNNNYGLTPKALENVKKSSEWLNNNPLGQNF